MSKDKEVITRLCPRCGYMISKEINESAICSFCQWLWNDLTITWEEFKKYMEEHRCSNCNLSAPRKNDDRCAECYAMYYCETMKHRK